MNTRIPAATLAALLSSLALADNPAFGTRTDEYPATSEAVRAKLAQQSDLSLEQLKVVTDEDGTVYLTGRTYSQAAADRATQVARTTPGVRRVKNEITVAPESRQ